MEEKENDVLTLEHGLENKFSNKEKIGIYLKIRMYFFFNNLLGNLKIILMPITHGTCGILLDPINLRTSKIPNPN